MNSGLPQVLLVDRDIEALRMTAKRLILDGFEVTVAQDSAKAFKILEVSKCDLLIADLATVAFGEMNLIDWAATVGCAKKIVVMFDSGLMTSDHKALVRRACLSVCKPLDVTLIADLIDSPTNDHSFGGRVEGVDLLDFIQFMLLSAGKTVVQVHDRGGGHGQIFIESGRIVHAVFGRLEGEDALFECLRCPGGRFANEQWFAPDRRTVNKPADFLLIEAARCRDEARNEIH